MVNTDNVETTDSLAVIPVINEVDKRQSENPNGSKIGAINYQYDAKILLALSTYDFKSKIKLCKNQINKEATKIIVKAFFKKSFAFSHICIITFLAEGIR